MKKKERRHDKSRPYRSRPSRHAPVFCRVTKVVSAFFETVADELKAGGEVPLSGFGKFSVKNRPARKEIAYSRKGKDENHTEFVDMNDKLRRTAPCHCRTPRGTGCHRLPERRCSAVSAYPTHKTMRRGGRIGVVPERHEREASPAPSRSGRL
ncbi:MAG: HU family DNA-binding protein [Desulfovibrio sp.]|nr:HU family DNA-binding protein [Desulfovibrio sp.]